MQPYILRWYDDKAYRVHDRTTDEEVGYVLGRFQGWAARTIMGREVVERQFLRDAAGALYEEWIAGKR